MYDVMGTSSCTAKVLTLHPRLPACECLRTSAPQLDASWAAALHLGAGTTSIESAHDSAEAGTAAWHLMSFFR